MSHPEKRQTLETRLQLEAALRRFFSTRDYREVHTPLLVASPGMETHIRPMKVVQASGVARERGAYLPTSPEFAMKRLLAQGWERIYQLCPAFRDEPVSPHHLPEFTMLEWYRSGFKLMDLMNEVEELFEALGAVKCPVNLDLRRPWPRLRVAGLFKEFAGFELTSETPREQLAQVVKAQGLPQDLSASGDSWDDLFFKLWLNLIEPKLPQDRPCFVYDYPPSQAALAEVETDARGLKWAKRFEVFAGGFELANAFQELRDPILQRARFQKDMSERERVYGPEFPASPIDEKFMAALPQMPACSGIALGWNRLVLLLTGASDIKDTVWLEPEW